MDDNIAQQNILPGAPGNPGNPIEWLKIGGTAGIVCFLAVTLLGMLYWSMTNTIASARLEHEKRELVLWAKIAEEKAEAKDALKSQREFSKARSDADRDAMKIIAAADKLTRDADRAAIVELTLEIKRLMERMTKMQMAAFIEE